MLKPIQKFLKLESASSVLLFIAAVLALIVANSPIEHLYDALLTIPVEVRFGRGEIAKPLLLWVNDGLMAVFFLLVGLELKREVLDGELREPAQVALPAMAALGGMLVPAAFYVFLNWGDTKALSGWAIPAATDIAFALGVLSAFGTRAPLALKVFLLTIAIIDDIGAIVIIALFYSGNISMSALAVAALAISVLAILNNRGFERKTPYILFGLLMWVAVLKSGVHATLAGVVLAMFIPYSSKEEGGDSPLKTLEHDLHPTVAFIILPVFAFFNSGVSLEGVTLAALLNPITLGVVLGLFVGKQIGVFGFAFIADKLGIGKLPAGVTWGQVYGVSILCGIGFTMSLFIGSLAFEEGGPALDGFVRLGIMSGSLISAIVGYFVLSLTLGKEQQ